MSIVFLSANITHKDRSVSWHWTAVDCYTFCTLWSTQPESVDMFMVSLQSKMSLCQFMTKCYI